MSDLPQYEVNVSCFHGLFVAICEGFHESSAWRGDKAARRAAAKAFNARFPDAIGRPVEPAEIDLISQNNGHSLFIARWTGSPVEMTQQPDWSRANGNGGVTEGKG